MIKQRAITLLAVGWGLVIGVQAESIKWDFEGPEYLVNRNNETDGEGDPSLMNDTSVGFLVYGLQNTFGSGVSVGNFILSANDRGTEIAATGRAGTEYNGTGVASTGVRSDLQTASFSITVDDQTTVDLTSLSFEYGFNEAVHPDTVEPGFSLAVDGVTGASITSGGTGGVLVPETGSFRDDFTAVFGGLQGLTDTTVKFTWTFLVAEVRDHADRRHFLDNIELIGTAVPEPATIGLLGLSAGWLFLARRR